MITWVLFLGIGLVIGVIAGLYFGRLDDVTNRQKKIMQQKLELTEQQLNTYKSQVAEHFLKTASLVNSMTESYKAVHEHLAHGARELCDTGVTGDQLEMPEAKLVDVAVTAQEKPLSDEQVRFLEQRPKSAEKISAVGDKSTELSASDKAERSAEPSVEQTLADQPLAEQKSAEQASEEKTVEAIAPPSTPESLHVDDSESTAPTASVKETEPAATANVSRMVH